MRDREFDAAQAGFDGLWELDLFCRVRLQRVEAARADVGVSAATLQDARVSVIAEVARDYFHPARTAGSAGLDPAQCRQSSSIR